MGLYIGLAVAFLALIIAVTILCITVSGRKKVRKNNAVYSGGYNTDTGLKEEASGKLFVGLNNAGGDTYCFNGFHKDTSKKISLFNCSNGNTYQIKIYTYLTIGRSPQMSGENYLGIEGDTTISRNHCRLEQRSNDIYITDLDSSNHTFLNGEQIDTSKKVNKGDCIKIGKTKLKIYF